MASIDSVVLPGDFISDLHESESTGKIILGPGLKRSDTESESPQALVTKPGVLRHKPPNVYWVDSHQKRVHYTENLPQVLP